MILLPEDLWDFEPLHSHKLALGMPVRSLIWDRGNVDIARWEPLGQWDLWDCLCWLPQTASLLFLQLNEEQAIQKYIVKYPVRWQRLGNWQAGGSFSLTETFSLP